MTSNSTPTTFVFPYVAGSQALNEISTVVSGFNVRRIRKQNSKFKGSATRSVINWGYRGALPSEVAKCNVLNTPTAVDTASNKLKFFKAMKDYAVQSGVDLLTPQFTEDKQQVWQWIQEGRTVFARTDLTGNSGRGIIELNTHTVEDEEDVEDAPLYTLYKPKRREFRVHVWGGQVFDVQEKLRSRDAPDHVVNWRIRSHDNGFIFARNHEAMYDMPPSAVEVALKAIQVCGLVFGGVDVIYNERENRSYAIEVNTAPGVTGSTALAYAEKFQEYAK